MLRTSYCYGTIVLLISSNSSERGVLEMDMTILSIMENAHELLDGG